jgi:hypothetical protein
MVFGFSSVFFETFDLKLLKTMKQKKRCTSWQKGNDDSDNGRDDFSRART